MKTLLQLLLPQQLQPPLQLRPLAVLTTIPIVQIGLTQATVMELTKLGWHQTVLSLATLTNMKHIVHTGLKLASVLELTKLGWQKIALSLVIAKLEKKLTELIFETLTKKAFFSIVFCNLFNLDTCINKVLHTKAFVMDHLIFHERRNDIDGS